MAVQSWPLRVNSAALPSSIRARTREPSNLISSLRQFRRKRRELGLERCGQVRLRRLGECPLGSLFVTDRGCDGCGGPWAALFDRSKRLGDDAVRQRSDNVVVRGRLGPSVALLEQHPRFLLLARLLDADQLPETGELLAVQAEDHLAGRERCPSIALRLPGPLVPDDHRAGAVLLRRDHTLPARVEHRMVLGADRHPHDLGSKLGPFGMAQLSRTPSSSRRKS